MSFGLRFLDWPLRAKMAVLLMVASLAPLLVAALMDVREARQQLTAKTSALLAARAERLVGELDAYHREYQRSATRFARLPAIVEFCRAEAMARTRRSEDALAVLRVQPFSDTAVRGAALLDAQGNVTLSTEPALQGAELGANSYVRKALTGADVISDVHFSPASVGSVPSIAYVVAVRADDAQPVGFVVLWVKAQVLWERANAAESLLGPGSFAMLLDRDGVRIGHTASRDVLFHPTGKLSAERVAVAAAAQRFGPDTRQLLDEVRPFPEVFERASASRPERSMFRGLAPFDSRWHFGVARRLQAVPWTVIYFVPEDSVLNEIARVTNQKVAFAAFIILVALFAGGLFGSFILRPITLLQNATRALAVGDLEARVRTSRGDELGQLGRSFDAMAERIQEQSNASRTVNDDLEARVRTRTAELASVAEALKHREEDLATTLHSIGDAVIATDADGLVTRMNAVAEQLTGWSLGDARGKPLEDVFQIFNEDTHERGENPVLRVLREGCAVGLANHTVLRSKDGREHPIADSGAPIRDLKGRLRGVVLVFRDQSVERRAEQALRDSDARKGAILEAALDCIVSMDHQGNITEFNPAAEKTFGYARSDVMGKPLVELLIPPALRDAHRSAVGRYLQSESPRILGQRLELSAVRAGGEEFPVELAVVRLRAEGPPMFTAYIRDIAERKRAEHALAASEARFRHLSQSGIIGIIITDTAGNIEEANDAFLRIVRYSREDFETGKLRWTEMTPPEWQKLDEIAVESVTKTGVAQPWRKEYLRKDGTRAAVLVGAAMLDSPRAIAFVLDLSEQRRAEEVSAEAAAIAELEAAQRLQAEQALRRSEEQLQQFQKMEAIGTMAGSIAHDFNNLLSVILSYCEMVLEGLLPADPMRLDIEQIARAGRRAGDLTRQLLAFSRRQVLEPKVVDLNESIAAMGTMLRRLIGEDVELRIVTSSKRGTVFVNPGQAEQVLMNLIVNARDAMPRGGKLTIETADVEIDVAYASEHLDMDPGNYVMVSVSDTGVGIDRATQARIFEPFFTTKPRDKGTGLGLSTVFGIVKQSGGHIWVYSEPGEGTTFKVYLPRSDSTAEPSLRTRPAPSTLRGDETVLLVEDEDQVRALAVTILRRHGYQVLEASGGGDALLICEQYRGEIHILLTDVIMPRMSGRELWERLAPLRPNMKVLFMSGYTDDAIVHHGVLSSELAFVQKPLMPAPLLLKLRNVLDSAVTLHELGVVSAPSVGMSKSPNTN
ncbi:MAG: PAS domain S-box protein [Polyangiaceae bacterium]